MPSFGPTSRHKEVYAKDPALTRVSPDLGKTSAYLLARTLTLSRRPFKGFGVSKIPSPLGPMKRFTPPHVQLLNGVTP